MLVNYDEENDRMLHFYLTTCMKIFLPDSTKLIGYSYYFYHIDRYMNTVHAHTCLHTLTCEVNYDSLACSYGRRREKKERRKRERKTLHWNDAGEVRIENEEKKRKRRRKQDSDSSRKKTQTHTKHVHCHEKK